MKVVKVVLICLLISNLLYGQGWKHTFGGRAEDDCRAVLQSADGGYFLIGHSESFGDGDRDVYITRLEVDGTIAWTNYYDEEFKEWGNAALLTEENGVLVAGESKTTGLGANFDAFLLETDAAGNLLWRKTYGGTGDDRINTITATADGGYVLAGYSESFGNGNSDAYILKVDASGEELWSNSYGSLEDEVIKAVVAVEDGYVLVGNVRNSFGNNLDIYVLKVDLEGNLLWNRTYGTHDTFEEANDVAVLPSGELLIAGNQGVSDFYLFKTDPTGSTVIWENTYGSGREEYCNAMVLGNDNSILLVGSTDIDGVNADICLVKVTLSGNPIWTRQFGDEERFEQGVDVIVTQDDGYAIGGHSGLQDNGLVYDYVFVKTDDKGNLFSNRIEGQIFYDVNENCSWDEGLDVPLKDWLVRIGNEEETYYTATDDAGNYSVLTDVSAYTVTALVPNEDYWTPCQNNLNRVFTTTYDTLRAVNFPIKADVQCPYLEVDIAAPSLSACSSVNYTVSYRNTGTALAPDARIKVDLDEFMQFNSSEIAETLLAENSYEFALGDLPIGIDSSFQINVSLACEGYVTGQTHRVSAEISPQEYCLEPSSDWDFASIEVSGICEEQKDSLGFTIRNIGDGDMTDESQFSIAVEDLVFFSAPIQLDQLEEEFISFKATGETFRIIAEQVDGHPGNSFPTIAIEGCGTDEQGTISTGFVGQFKEDDSDPFISINVQENGNSTGTQLRSFPKGYREEHLIERNTEITYHIEFQNITTDKEINYVTIRDTLPAELDINSIQLGASSHLFDFEVYGDRILKFVFKDIELSSINVDEAGSKGFVQFRVQQLPNLDKGTRIENRAAVYMAFKKPFSTNTVFHTVGGALEDFVEVGEMTSTQDLRPEGVEVLVAPNPFIERTQLSIDGWDSKVTVNFRLFNSIGQLVRTQGFEYNRLIFQRNELDSGLYFYEIIADGQRLDSGQLVIQ